MSKRKTSNLCVYSRKLNLQVSQNQRLYKTTILENIPVSSTRRTYSGLRHTVQVNGNTDHREQPLRAMVKLPGPVDLAGHLVADPTDGRLEGERQGDVWNHEGEREAVLAGLQT